MLKKKKKAVYYKGAKPRNLLFNKAFLSLTLSTGRDNDTLRRLSFQAL